SHLATRIDLHGRTPGAPPWPTSASTPTRSASATCSRGSDSLLRDGSWSPTRSTGAPHRAASPSWSRCPCVSTETSTTWRPRSPTSGRSRREGPTAPPTPVHPDRAPDGGGVPETARVWPSAPYNESRVGIPPGDLHGTVPACV